MLYKHVVWEAAVRPIWTPLPRNVQAHPVYLSACPPRTSTHQSAVKIGFAELHFVSKKIYPMQHAHTHAPPTHHPRTTATHI